MTVLAPKDGPELEAMLELSLESGGPCAIRYPRGTAIDLGMKCADSFGKSIRLRNGTDADIWAVGSMVKPALDAAELLAEEGISAGVVNMACVSPLDEDMLMEVADASSLLVTVEDGIITGGVGEAVKALTAEKDSKVINLGWPDQFIEHGTQEQLYQKYGLDAGSIANVIRQNIR